MRKMVAPIVGTCFFVGLYLVLIPRTRDEVHWRWASHWDKMTNYESYLKTWPSGRHSVEAKARYDERCWAEANTGNTVRRFETYLERQPKGTHVYEAKDAIEALHWREATTVNSVYAFERYLALHPRGRHVTEATESLHWQQAIDGNDDAGFERYVQLHPSGKYVTQVEDNLDSLHWREATTYKTDSGVIQYLKRHPNGTHVVEAKDKLDSLHWEEAMRTNTIKGFAEYIEAHGNGTHVKDARTRIGELRERFAKVTVKAPDTVRAGRTGEPGKFVRVWKYALTFCESNGFAARLVPASTQIFCRNGTAYSLTDSGRKTVRLPANGTATFEGELWAENGIIETYLAGDARMPKVQIDLKGARIRIEFNGEDASGNDVFAEAKFVLADWGE